MRQLLSTLLLATPLALLAPPASAQVYGYTNTIGNTTFGTYNTPRGSYHLNTQQIGNTTFSNVNGPNGVNIRCTTQVIGNSVFQNCN